MLARSRFVRSSHARPSRAVPASLALVSLLAVVTTTTSARAEGAYKARETEVHGSQTASSEWLPIFIGAAGGVIVGGLAGGVADTHQPPVLGSFIGAGIGGFTGGAAGAWLIRSSREQDTRLAGALTGLGLGTGLGTTLFVHIDQTGGKVAALVLLPVMGLFAGRALAVHYMDKPKEPSAVALASFQATAAPVYTEGRGASGFTFGVGGAFF